MSRRARMTSIATASSADRSCQVLVRRMVRGVRKGRKEARCARTLLGIDHVALRALDMAATEWFYGGGSRTCPSWTKRRA